MKLSTAAIILAAGSILKVATAGYGATYQGYVVGCGFSRRQLSAVNGSNIEGNLVMGDITGEEKPADHFLKVDATGLASDCSDDCAIAIALANSLECTVDVEDSALKVVLQKELVYSTGEEGSTNGWFKQVFDNVESDSSPISLSEVFSMIDAAPGSMSMDSSNSTHFAPVVYLYDKEKVPVACAYLASLSPEEKTRLDMLFNGEQSGAQDIESTPSDAAAAVDVGNGSGRVALVPEFVVSVITACALFLL